MSNVHSWYVADELTKPEDRCEREAKVQSAYLHCSVFINGEQIRSLISTVRSSIKLTK